MNLTNEVTLANQNQEKTSVSHFSAFSLYIQEITQFLLYRQNSQKFSSFLCFFFIEKDKTL